MVGDWYAQPGPTHPIPEPHLGRKSGDTGQNEPAVVAHDAADRRWPTRPCRHVVAHGVSDGEDDEERVLPPRHRHQTGRRTERHPMPSRPVVS